VTALGALGVFEAAYWAFHMFKSERESEPLNEHTFISRAVFADARLWVLNYWGELSSIIPGAKARVSAGLADRVLDVCTADGAVQILSCAREACNTWTLRRRTEGGWTTLATLPAESDVLAALSCTRARTIVLTEHRLIQISDGKSVPLRLSQKIDGGIRVSLHLTPEHVFVGINVGEWGGGVRRVELETGRVSVIEKITGGPVHAIVDDPWQPGCLLAAIGLVHLGARGWIAGLCEQDVREVYARALGNPEDPDEPGRARSDSFEAFFGLARVGTQLVATGIDGIYRFDGPGEPARTPLPEFETIGDVEVSFALPDVVLVRTNINRQASLGGAVPLLVPR